MKRSFVIATLALSAALFFCSCASSPAKKPEPSPQPTPLAAPAPAPVAAPVKASEAGGIVLDDFEGSAFAWKSVGASWNDGDGSLEAVLNEDPIGVTQGKKSAAMSFDIAAGKGASFYEDFAAAADWSAFKSVKVDAVNPNEEIVKITLFFKTGPSWEWHQTKQIELRPGANKGIVFGLQDGSLANAASGWQNTANLNNPQAVMTVGFKFFANLPLKGKMYVDNIQLLK
jgi:hypothetical protein